MRVAFTLPEVMTTLVIVGIVSGIAVPYFRLARDRAAVHGATSALTGLVADTRHLATRWNRRTALTVDTASALAVVRASADTLKALPLQPLFGVKVGATRDSIAYYPSGLGFGAANTRFIVTRGAAAETITVSRAGRVHR